MESVCLGVSVEGLGVGSLSIAIKVWERGSFVGQGGSDSWVSPHTTQGHRGRTQAMELAFLSCVG